jgi:hypothetical protein
VALAFALVRHFPIRHVIPYIAGQLAGALLGSVAVLYLIAGGENIAGLCATHPSNGAMPALVFRGNFDLHHDVRDNGSRHGREGSRARSGYRHKVHAVARRCANTPLDLSQATPYTVLTIFDIWAIFLVALLASSSAPGARGALLFR